jgi:hypothetical protein
MKTTTTFSRCCGRIVANGEITFFLEDRWIGDKPLREKFPRLYLLTFSVNIIVANMSSKSISTRPSSRRPTRLHRARHHRPEHQRQATSLDLRESYIVDINHR